LSNWIGIADGGIVGSDGTHTLTIAAPTVGSLSGSSSKTLKQIFETTGGGGIASVVAGAGINVDNTDPDNPVVSSSATGIVETVAGGFGISVSGTAEDPIVSAALSSANVNSSGNVTMTDANTFYTGVSTSLAAGTWLVIATITYRRAATTVTRYTSRLGDGTTHYAAAEGAMPSLNPHTLSHTLSAVITLGSTTTIGIEGASTTTLNTILATPALNNTGLTDMATNIRAIRIT
jgi:hypothetical protein